MNITDKLAEALPDDAEAVVACLGDDAAEMLGENPEDERALNMQRAAEIIDARMTSVTFRPLSRYDFDVAAAAYDENARLDISHRVRLCRAIESILPHGMPVVGDSVEGHAP